MKNNSKTFIWVVTTLLIILTVPKLYIDYDLSPINKEERDKSTDDELADIVRNQDPEFYKDWTDAQIAGNSFYNYPELRENFRERTPGEKKYDRIGSAGSSFWERFEAQLDWQWEKIYGGQFFPWYKYRENAKAYAENMAKGKVKNRSDLQVYIFWKEDKPQTNDFASFLRTLSESLPSIILIGFPLFILSMFNFFFISKNDMNEIIKKYGFDKKGFSKFNLEVKGIVGSFFKFFIYWYLISKSIFIAGIEIIGVSRKQKKSLKPQEIELKNNAKTLILTFMQAEGVILLATFSYFVFQSN